MAIRHSTRSVKRVTYVTFVHESNVECLCVSVCVCVCVGGGLCVCMKYVYMSFCVLYIKMLSISGNVCYQVQSSLFAVPVLKMSCMVAVRAMF